MNKDPFSFQNTDWLKIQQQYMDTLASLSGQTNQYNQLTGSDNPWQKALEFWWQSILSSAPDDTYLLFKQLRNQSWSLYSLNDKFARLLADISATEKGSNDWRDIFCRYIEELKLQLAAPEVPVDGGNDSMMSFWRLPVELWLQNITGLSQHKGAQSKISGPEAVQDAMQKFISLPGLGYNREYQQKILEGVNLWDEYQNNSREFMGYLGKAGVRSLDIFQNKVLDLADSHKKISSLRELYDLWIDCNEEAYFEVVMTDEYARIYGRLINSFAAFKEHSQQIIDEILSAMNLPTQQGMNSVREKQQVLHREIQDVIIKQQSSIEEINSIKAELEQLREMLARPKKSKR